MPRVARRQGHQAALTRTCLDSAGGPTTMTIVARFLCMIGVHRWLHKRNPESGATYLECERCQKQKDTISIDPAVLAVSQVGYKPANTPTFAYRTRATASVPYGSTARTSSGASAHLDTAGGPRSMTIAWGDSCAGSACIGGSASATLRVEKHTGNANAAGSRRR